MNHDIRMYPLDIFMDAEILREINPELYKDWGKVALSLAGSHAERVEDEAEFLEILKKIFSSQKTKQLIAAMLAQST